MLNDANSPLMHAMDNFLAAHTHCFILCMTQYATHIGRALAYSRRESRPRSLRAG